jgi:hypothetical protein
MTKYHTVGYDKIPHCRIWQNTTLSDMTKYHTVEYDKIPHCRIWQNTTLSDMTKYHTVGYDKIPHCRIWQYQLATKHQSYTTRLAFTLAFLFIRVLWFLATSLFIWTLNNVIEISNNNINPTLHMFFCIYTHRLSCRSSITPRVQMYFSFLLTFNAHICFYRGFVSV